MIIAIIVLAVVGLGAYLYSKRKPEVIIEPEAEEEPMVEDYIAEYLAMREVIPAPYEPPPEEPVAVAVIEPVIEPPPPVVEPLTSPVEKALVELLEPKFWGRLTLISCYPALSKEVGYAWCEVRYQIDSNIPQFAYSIKGGTAIGPSSGIIKAWATNWGPRWASKYPPYGVALDENITMYANPDPNAHWNRYTWQVENWQVVTGIRKQLSPYY